MESPIKKAISSAVLRLLQPLVKILLRNGISYGLFCEFAKIAYVDVASKEFFIPGRKQSVSRVAIITGLSRKEVSRISNINLSEDLGADDRYNRAVRVISGWRKGPLFLGSNGKPRELKLEGEGDSFSSLVKMYSGDVPPRAVLDEMLRAGIVDLKNGKIRLLEGGYIVRKGEIEKIHILGTDVSEMMSTIDHNLQHDPDDAFFQRKVSYDNIPAEALDDIRGLLFDRSAQFVESMDRLISKYDRDVNPSVKGQGRSRAGLGIYYFE